MHPGLLLCTVPRMPQIECVGCKDRFPQESLERCLGTLLLCRDCAAAARSAEMRIERDLEEAKAQARLLLIHHIAHRGIIKRER